MKRFFQNRGLDQRQHCSRIVPVVPSVIYKLVFQPVIHNYPVIPGVGVSCSVLNLQFILNPFVNKTNHQ